MKSQRNRTGLLLLFVIAAAGFALVSIPSWVAGHVEAISEIGPRWLVYVYLAVVGTGTVLLLGASATIVWRLWQRTRKKQRRRRSAKRIPVS